MDDEKYGEDRYLIESLQNSGYCCTQIIVKMALDKKGVENEEMVNALSALCGGIKTGNNCGALTGAAILLAMADKHLSPVTIMALVSWFKNTYGELDCFAIVGETREKRAELCPSIIQDSYFKALEILEEYNLSLGN